MTELTSGERAEILTQALPYIKRYNGKIVVVKYGGNAMTNDVLKEHVMEDIVLLTLVGAKVVLVHGGGPEINDLMGKLGKEPQFVNGLRVTDKETMDIVQMILPGKINKSLVSLIEKIGGKAMGISGIDGNLIEAVTKNPELGFVGEITKVDPRPILDLLSLGYIPVVSTVGGDFEGNVYNINGDTAAAAIAGALGAERLIMMTNTAGILKDMNDPGSLIRNLTVDEARSLMGTDIVSGGMIPKVECCIDAISKGVKNVVILDGRIPHSLLLELLTDEGSGTMIKGGKS